MAGLEYTFLVVLIPLLIAGLLALAGLRTYPVTWQPAHRSAASPAPPIQAKRLAAGPRHETALEGSPGAAVTTTGDADARGTFYHNIVLRYNYGNLIAGAGG